VLSNFFPNLVTALTEGGATVIDIGSDMHGYQFGGYKVRYKSDANNCLAMGWGEVLKTIRNDTEKWNEFLYRPPVKPSIYQLELCGNCLNILPAIIPRKFCIRILEWRF